MNSLFSEVALFYAFGNNKLNLYIQNCLLRLLHVCASRKRKVNESISIEKNKQIYLTLYVTNQSFLVTHHQKQINTIKNSLTKKKKNYNDMTNPLTKLRRGKKKHCTIRTANYALPIKLFFNH